MAGGHAHLERQVTDPRPRPTRRQFVCPDPLWARVIQQAREERTNASQWVREAIERRLEEADNHYGGGYWCSDFHSPLLSRDNGGHIERGWIIIFEKCEARQ
jgi:hypothetical protein